MVSCHGHLRGAFWGPWCQLYIFWSRYMHYIYLQYIWSIMIQLNRTSVVVEKKQNIEPILVCMFEFVSIGCVACFVCHKLFPKQKCTVVDLESYGTRLFLRRMLGVQLASSQWTDICFGCETCIGWVRLTSPRNEHYVDFVTVSCRMRKVW